MATQEILCLAFSRREGGHCFAGIELDNRTWVRPVRSPEAGPLHYYQCLVKNAEGALAEPRTLDIIEMELVSACPKLSQPENWLLGNAPWRLAGRAASSDVRAYVTDDPELFRGYERSVEVSELEAHPPASSLRLVSPANLTWFAEETSYRKRRLRGRFSIGGVCYDLPLTDDAYEKQIGDIALHAQRKHPPSAQVLLTLSLSDLWRQQMRHYKLIAGVIL